MRKIIYAFLSLFLCCPSVANVMIPADAVISTVQEFVPADRNTAVISEYNKLLTAANGAGISARALWDICKVAGWDISSESGKLQCEQFATELLSRASVSFYPACDKKYKGKSSYVCVDDFFTNKIYGGTQVNLTPGQTLAQEYARLKHNDSSVLCKSDFDKGVLDYKLMCTSYKQNTYYEFVFDDLEEPKDKIIQDSIQTAICRMYNAKPTTAGCAGGGTNVSGTTTCWSASCAADSAKCAKINQSRAKFGYITRYKNNNCEIDFNTIYKREELKTAYDIDNFVFCHGIQVSNTPNVETYLKQYVADRAGVSETSVKCDSGFKTYTGTGCTRDGITDFKDDIKTCYVGDNQIDFVFDDINEKWKKIVEGGVQGMSCIVTGGTYSGERCIGLGEQQCNILRQSNLTECPECKAARWDKDTESCILPSSADAQNLQKGVNITLIAGGVIAGVVITVASFGGFAATAAAAGAVATGTATTAQTTAIVFTSLETIGGVIELNQQLKINGIADNFLVESNKCHDATCAKEMLSQNLQRMANLQNDMTPAEADAVDSELARLANLIPDDDDIWATMLVNGTDMADNKAGFWESWEPEQVWRAVGIGLQLASLITGITKWAISKSSRIAKSTTAIKNKLTAAVDSVERAIEGTLSGTRLELKQKFAILDTVEAMKKNTNFVSDTDAAWQELFEKYGVRNHDSIEEFKEITDGDLAKMQDQVKGWVSWDEAAEPDLAFVKTQNQIDEYLKKHPDAIYYYQNAGRLDEKGTHVYVTEHRELMHLMQKQDAIMQIQDEGISFGSYTTWRVEQNKGLKNTIDIENNISNLQKNKVSQDLLNDPNISVDESLKILDTESKKIQQQADDNILRQMGAYVSDNATDRVALLRAKQMKEIIDQDQSLLAKKANWKNLSINEKEEYANELAVALMKKNGIHKNHPPVYDFKQPAGTGGFYSGDEHVIAIDFSQQQEFDHFINTLSHETSHAIDYMNPNSGAVGGQLQHSSQPFFGNEYDAYRAKPTEQSSWKIGAYTEILNSDGTADALLDALRGAKPIQVYDYKTKQILYYQSSGYDVKKLLSDLFDSNKDIAIFIDSNTPSTQTYIKQFTQTGYFRPFETESGKYYVIKAIKTD